MFFRETLEGGRYIAKAKGNHQELLMAFVSVKNSFRNIHLLHANLVIIQVKIESGESLSTLELIQIVINN